MSTLIKAHQKGFIRYYFRLQRVLLTPFLGKLISYVLPVCACAAAAAVLLFSDENFERLKSVTEAKIREIASRPGNQVSGLRVIASSEKLRLELAALVTETFPRDILSFDLDELRRRAESIPAVQSAKVFADPGGLLTISAVERLPAVIFRSGDRLLLLDESGSVLAEADSRRDHIDLPLVTGEGAEHFVSEALRIYAAASHVRKAIRGLNRIGMRRWDLILDGGHRVFLPAESPAEAVQRLLVLENAELLLQRKLAVVDLRDSQRISVRLSETTGKGDSGV